MLISERTPLLWSLVAFVEGPKSKRREIGTTTRKREPRFRLHYSREIRVYLCCGAVYYESREKADTRRRSDKGRGGEREREREKKRTPGLCSSQPHLHLVGPPSILRCSIVCGRPLTSQFPPRRAALFCPVYHVIGFSEFPAAIISTLTHTHQM